MLSLLAGQINRLTDLKLPGKLRDTQMEPTLRAMRGWTAPSPHIFFEALAALVNL